tara:strand:+ start:122 stop:913 length:792 start_codon:yes stop_codon:yes gene_type:complete
MRLTLLEITQEILSDMNSDNVNSIFDTEESEQVATIVRSAFFAMINTREWPHLRQSIQVVPYSNTAQPTHMAVTEKYQRLVLLNYNCARDGETRKRYRSIKYRHPDEFLQVANQLNTDSDNVDIVLDDSGVELFIRNDKAPEFFTSFDDKTLIFDSYDGEVDDSLQNSKVQAVAFVVPEWEMSDSFVPDLPDEAFTALVEDAKSKAQFKLKQMEDAPSAAEARRQQRWLSQKSWKVHDPMRYADYGRKGRKMYRDPTFKQDKM